MDQEVRHALGVLCRVGDAERRALRDADRRYPLEPRRIDHHLKVREHRVEGDVRAPSPTVRTLAGRSARGGSGATARSASAARVRSWRIARWSQNRAISLQRLAHYDANWGVWCGVASGSRALPAHNANRRRTGAGRRYGRNCGNYKARAWEAWEAWEASASCPNRPWRRQARP